MMSIDACEPRREKRNAGFALILVLFVVVLITLMVVNFSYRVQVNAAVVGNETNRTEAYWFARSEVARGKSLLMVDLTQQPGVVEEGKFVPFDSFDDPWAVETDMPLTDDAVTALRIEDEYGKLNLNALITRDSGTGEQKEQLELVAALRALFRDRGLETDPVDQILDWIDSDNEPRANGAEQDYYESLMTPFTCKNAPIDSLEELLLLPGIDADAYFGDPEEGRPPLRALLTVNGHQAGMINVNTARIEVLTALFEGEGRASSPEDLAIQVDDFRMNVGPLITQEDLQSFDLIPTPEREASDEGGQDSEELGEFDQDGENERETTQPVLVTTSSNVFRILADAESGDSAVRIETVVWRDTNSVGTHSMLRTLSWKVSN